MGSSATDQREHTFSAPRELLAANHQLVQRLVDEAARRSRLSGADRDDFEGIVWVRLVDRDFHILRRFEHRCSLRTYLTVVVRRSLLDYRNARWGKWRPSAAAVRKGAKAVRLERLVRRDGIPEGVAAAQLGMSPDELRPSRRVRALRIQVSLQDAADLASGPAQSPDAAIRASERSATASLIREALRFALETLSRAEQNLLWLRHQQGLPISLIGRRVGIDGKRLYRMYEGIYLRLRTILEARGVSREAFASVIGDSESWIDDLLVPPDEDAWERRPCTPYRQAPVNDGACAAVGG